MYVFSRNEWAECSDKLGKLVFGLFMRFVDNNKHVLPALSFNLHLPGSHHVPAASPWAAAARPHCDVPPVQL